LLIQLFEHLPDSMKKAIKRNILPAILFFVCITKLDGQAVKFRHFGVEEGICHPSIYTINQDRNGYLWTGTGEGLCRFNGIDFSKPFQGDSVSNSFGACSYRDIEGNLWFGHDDGSLTVWDGKEVERFHEPERINSTINSITGNGEGIIYAASQNNGILVINLKRELVLLDSLFPGELLYSLAIGSGGELLVGTGNGLYICTTGADGIPGNPVKLTSFPLTRVTTITPFKLEDKFLAGTEDMGIIQIQGKGTNPAAYTISDFGSPWGLEYTGVTSILQDAGKNLWIATQGEGVYELLWSEKEEKWVQKIQFNVQNGLGNDFVKSIFQDREGILWMGSYGNGLDALTGSALQFYAWEKEIGKDIKAVAAEGSSWWVAGKQAILQVSFGKTTSQKLYKISSVPLLDEITCLSSDPQGNIWAGTRLSGVFRLAKGAASITRVYSSPNSLRNFINHILIHKDTVFVSTTEGLVFLDMQGRELGSRTMSDLLPHNIIHQVFVSHNGRVMIATKTSGLYDINSNKTLEAGIRGEVEFNAITEDPQGNFWAATNGSGVLCFQADTILQFTTRNGLASNYVYSIQCDKFGMVWAGHRLALSRISSTGFTVAVFERSSGISADCNPNAMAVTAEGALMVGTTDGLIVYDARLDQNTGVPPALNLVSVRINDELFDPNEPIRLRYGDYKLKLEFKGLNYRSPDRVTYQYKFEGLKGYDQWSEPTGEGIFTLPILPDGDFTFLLKACNEDGQCTGETVMLKLHVSPPFWKIWWVDVLFVLAGAALIWAFIKYRERQLIEEKKRLEEEVERRTKQVVEQKEVIELQNRDIMDSIEYAKRIQESVLPSASKLQGIFSGSFIYYQPKATVSGDFYWFDKVGRDRFIIVCADSTGHGVPGAFMSMMGTTLVKDICYRSELESPSEMLAVLDREIGARLNQNLEGEQSNDGMDILICEVNLETYYIRIASAMRPYIIYQNGEQIYVQGSRSSIGGNIESKEEKIFEEKGFQLTKGDILYMFSDGYTDQFGGPMGRKYKMVRLRNLLTHIHQMPMTEQRNFVMSNFNLWKMDYNQVDDVLFMGVQI
jgi:ligand-binding sensor domain-containing protein/serine phosphatase RsbU (regulator of sigma subunit)